MKCLKGLGLALLLSFSLCAADEKVYECTGIKAHEMAAVLSDKYHKTILLSEDLREKQLFCTLYLADDLAKVLDVFSWQLGTEWLEKDNVIYMGGKLQKYEAMPSAGLSDQLKANFGEAVSTIGDKMVMKGTEREIKQISEVAKTVMSRNTVEVWLYAFEYSHDVIGNWGMTIKPHLEGSKITYEQFVDKKVTIDQFFDKSYIEAEYKTEFEDLEAKVVIDTSLTLLSGRNTKIVAGTQEDRQIYTAIPNTGQGQQFITSYQSYYFGLSIDLTAFEADDAWYIETYLENSVEKSQLVKNLTNLKTYAKIGKEKGKDLCVLASLDQFIDRKENAGIFNAIKCLRWFLPEQKEKRIKTLVVLMAVNRTRAKDRADFYVLNPPPVMYSVPESMMLTDTERKGE